MGLAVVLGVVQAHNGAIRLHSEQGKGTCFEILLPTVISSNEIETGEPDQTPGGWEDFAGRQMLTRLGYQVTACRDPLAALKLFRDNPESFNLVITDLTMPKLNGTKLAQHMLHLRPDLPIILCTGYGDEMTSDQATEIGIRELLFKPILRHQLAVAIRNSLDSVHPEIGKSGRDQGMRKICPQAFG